MKYPRTRGNAVPVVVVVVVVAVVALLLASVGAFAQSHLVRLATTTSTDNSGLLDNLLPQFERDSGYAVHVISVGTGRALRLGENGDVDVLLVHAPQRERRFMERGHGVHHRGIMFNDFVVVGPKNDPAGVREATSAADAFARVRRSESRFVSRGDESGTHLKELALWQQAGTGVADFGQWHLQAGQGMGKSLQVADELQAYLLIDRGTWIYLEAQTSLALLYQGDESLRNPYGVMAVNPKRHRVNIEGAVALIDWLASPRGQAAIGAYKVAGTRLFTPTTTAGND